MPTEEQRPPARPPRGPKPQQQPPPGRDAPEVNVGDEVVYVPHECHGLNKDINGDYPWALGVKKQTYRYPGPNQPPELAEEVHELGGRELEEFLAHLRRHPNPAEERKKLVFLRPNAHWRGRVTAVHDDGTADLDVPGSNGGVTLSYTRVPVFPHDEVATFFGQQDQRHLMHTCYVVPKVEKSGALKPITLEARDVVLGAGAGGEGPKGEEGTTKGGA